MYTFFMNQIQDENRIEITCKMFGGVYYFLDLTRMNDN